MNVGLLFHIIGSILTSKDSNFNERDVSKVRSFLYHNEVMWTPCMSVLFDRSHIMGNDEVMVYRSIKLYDLLMRTQSSSFRNYSLKYLPLLSKRIIKHRIRTPILQDYILDFAKRLTKRNPDNVYVQLLVSRLSTVKYLVSRQNAKIEARRVRMIMMRNNRRCQIRLLRGKLSVLQHAVISLDFCRRDIEHLTAFSLPSPSDMYILAKLREREIDKRQRLGFTPTLMSNRKSKSKCPDLDWQRRIDASYGSTEISLRFAGHILNSLTLTGQEIGSRRVVAASEAPIALKAAQIRSGAVFHTLADVRGLRADLEFDPRNKSELKLGKSVSQWIEAANTVLLDTRRSVTACGDALGIKQ
eukprot:gnl/Dysnectes_brevis/8661_a15556_303.p1 GENE.gnl/Dysnectes_brevis/8661_a15556_303~~gnl/Dysnectes_brevis/8661_a15556_303.p1  ORF type:complete len:357 (+),score=-18.91 gnl/Dysnectes_brevis/8661_a15556_303:25-1095(+)